MINDDKIVDLLRKSDATALKLVFEKYNRQIFNFLLYRVQEPHEAEDLLQDVYLRFWEYRETVTGENLLSYLYSIAGSLSHNRRRDKRNKLNFILKQEKRVVYPDTIGVDDQEKLLKQLERCIQQLTEKQRVTLLMHRIEGLTYREISNYLDLSIKAIEKRMRYAYKGLKECLEKIM